MSPQRAVPLPQPQQNLRTLRLLRDMQEAPAEPKIEALELISTEEASPQEAGQILSGLLILAAEPEHGPSVRGAALKAFTRGVQEARHAATTDHAAVLIRIAADNYEIEAIRLMALNEALSAVISKSPEVTFSVAKGLSIIATSAMTNKKMKQFEAIKTTEAIRNAANGLYRDIENLQRQSLTPPEPS